MMSYKVQSEAECAEAALLARLRAQLHRLCAAQQVHPPKSKSNQGLGLI